MTLYYINQLIVIQFLFPFFHISTVLLFSKKRCHKPLYSTTIVLLLTPFFFPSWHFFDLLLLCTSFKFLYLRFIVVTFRSRSPGTFLERTAVVLQVRFAARLTFLDFPAGSVVSPRFSLWTGTFDSSFAFFFAAESKYFFLISSTVVQMNWLLSWFSSVLHAELCGLRA